RISVKGEERKKTAQTVLLNILKDSLKLLHPIMPFITEEIWDVLPHEEGDNSRGAQDMTSSVNSIMQQPFPKTGADYPDAERDMMLIMDVIKAIRNIRSEMNVSPALTIEAVCYSSDGSVIRLLETEGRHIKTLSKVSVLKVSAPAGRPENCATAVAGNIEIFIPLKGLINFEEEEKRLKKDIEKIEKELLALERKMSNKEFIEKAPKEVIEKDKARLEELLQKKMKLEQGVGRVK
ncbi:MAG TPA: class I tRNA ligase family protein, partial [Thermodesulfobacteriota bacterium]|nr:class I tRNA ligase family protein [Thermodesulfobacteriota bacterium]